MVKWQMLSVATALGFAVASWTTVQAENGKSNQRQPQLGGRFVPVLTIAGMQFRDLDRDGRLSPFEDWRLPPEQRAADLVKRMTLEEKAGAMMHPVLSNSDPAPQIGKEHVTSFCRCELHRRVAAHPPRRRSDPRRP